MPKQKLHGPEPKDEPPPEGDPPAEDPEPVTAAPQPKRSELDNPAHPLHHLRNS